VKNARPFVSWLEADATKCASATVEILRAANGAALRMTRC